MKIYQYLLAGCLMLSSFTACKHPAVYPTDPIENTPGQPHLPGTEFIVMASMDKGLKVTLTWDAQTGNPTYRIMRASAADLYSDPNTMPYEKVGETKDHTFDDTQVSPNAVYYYKVQAVYSASQVVNSIVTVGRTTKPTNEDLAVVRYTQLGEATGGKRYDADGPSALLETIITIIKEHAGSSGADVVLLVDDTGSMGDDINAVKAGLNKLISVLPPGTRLSAATYNDLNEEPATWYNWLDLTTDYASIRTFINAIRTRGGGDLPESVYDGVYETLMRVHWASPKRIMIVVGDDAPLEGPKTKHSYEEVVATCKQAGVAANLYPILIKEDSNQGN